MSSFFEEEKEKKGTNVVFIVGAVIALVAVLGIAYVAIMIPSPEEEKAAVLEDAVREGSPEFENYTKEIIISTDPSRLKEAYTGLGDIVMLIGGRIRNKGNKTVTGLEVSVGMINTKNELIKDKKFLLVPEEHPELKPDETIDVSVKIPGFSEDDDRANARWKVTAIRFAEN